MGLKSPLLSLSSLIFSFIKTIKLFQSDSKFTIKLFSSRLNIKPYNRLDKEVVGFKECKEGLITLYNTKYFHYQNGKNKDNDKYKMYI